MTEIEGVVERLRDDLAHFVKEAPKGTSCLVYRDDIRALLAELERLKKALTDEQQKFQQETRRTSEQHQVLERFMAYGMETGCRPENWSKACRLCKLMADAKELMERPINVRAALAGETTTP